MAVLASLRRRKPPALLVHADGCAFPDHVRDVYARLQGPKELQWSEGNQIDFYDQPAQVDAAVAAVTAWFDRTCGRDGTSRRDDGRSRARAGGSHSDHSYRSHHRHAPLVRAAIVVCGYGGHGPTSLFRGEVQHQPGDALIDAWQSLLSPLDATQHLLGPVDVRLDDGRAVAECHVRGYHVSEGAPGGSEWMVAGQWIIELIHRDTRWLVDKMTLNTFYQTGNRGLLQQVGRR